MPNKGLTGLVGLNQSLGAMRRARPVSPRDVEKLGRLQCTEREAAAYLNIRNHEFRELLESEPACASAWERGQQVGRISLRRKQWRLAGASASMAIFLGKNLLGQRDISVHEVTGEDGAALFNADNLSQRERDHLRSLLARGSQPSGTGEKSRPSRR